MMIYRPLLEYFGPQNWWPMQRGFRPPEWEVCLGAVLTQNTNWSNVEKALSNLKASGIISKQDILRLGENELAELIKPSGYYNQKAKKLRILASFNGKVTRNNLLSLWGIGRETADSILLYAYNKPYFVIDAYTRRIFSRLGLVQKDSSYEELRHFFERNIPRDTAIYKEYHALIVELGKRFCRKKPLCNECPISHFCESAPSGDRDECRSRKFPKHR